MAGILFFDRKCMATKLIVIVGISIAMAVGMFFLGKLADGKEQEK